MQHEGPCASQLHFSAISPIFGADKADRRRSGWRCRNRQGVPSDADQLISLTAMVKGIIIFNMYSACSQGSRMHQRLDENILQRRFNHRTLQSVVVFFQHRRNPPLKNFEKGGGKR
jgi:hypothetical protein